MPNKLWAIVPAAGVGGRMGTKIPKQYLKLGPSTVLQITLDKLSAVANIQGIVVAISASDRWFDALVTPGNKVHRVEGGHSRAESVLSALKYLDSIAGAGTENRTWALVHDAARPCVKIENIQRLIASAYNANCGGILASAVADSLKKVESGVVVESVARANVWQAHTPQLYPATALLKALQLGLDRGLSFTDEAAAMALAGCDSIVVEDSRDNIKITLPEDLPLAEFILSQQQRPL